MIAENKAKTASHAMTAMAKSRNEVVTVPLHCALDCVICVQDLIAAVGQCVDFCLQFIDLLLVAIVLGGGLPDMQLSQAAADLE